ncbi:F-box/kelch-repeat protein At1g57790-like isoform X2 [Andrographis paniculata]|uniref:F-box/kelch-repeat protein At1g57790-like isoform X2 n=1 Tax=Andrographis paniculata TaxID=175694 RepID=UPI0021E7AB1A|nr:F-box/kelch-repeat protein At1g57790-like isoform X2 [Andrographis paniculata]
MFLRRSKRLNELANTSGSNNRVSNETAEQEARSDLSKEVLELILSRLSLIDNIRASVVCKNWLAAAVSVRKINKIPWPMDIPERSWFFSFYDLTQGKTHWLTLPGLRPAAIYYVKYGWLLSFDHYTCRLFFTNPYTRTEIECPKLEGNWNKVAFSAPPTLPSCIVFTVDEVTPDSVAIHTCHPGDKEWTTMVCENNRNFCCSLYNRIVVCNGIFYSLSTTGWVGVYHTEQCSWKVLPISPPNCLEIPPVGDWWKQRFLAEYDGEIVAVYAQIGVVAAVYRLDEVHGFWEKIEDLNGRTFFASLVTSYIKADLPGKMGDNIYFPRVQFHKQHRIMYSMRKRRYYPGVKAFDLSDESLLTNFWIDSPEGPIGGS